MHNSIILSYNNIENDKKQNYNIIIINVPCVYIMFTKQIIDIEFEAEEWAKYVFVIRILTN